ncbi:MAG: hypothetical protein NVS3B10_10320 [Polyangiales bacterium]
MFVSEATAIEKRLDALERDVAHYKQLYLEALERCRKLELGLLASKSEHLPPSDSQLALSVLGMMLDDKANTDLEAALAHATDEQKIPEHVRRKPTGRKPIPEELPRVAIEILPPDVQRLGTDAFDRIGEEVSETIERRPASLVVARVVRPKFVRKDRERDGATTVSIAEPPELPRAASPVPACSPTPSSSAGRITSRSTAWKPSSPAKDSTSRARPSADGTSS